MGIYIWSLALLLAGPPADDVVPINQQSIKIPIHIDPARRSEMQQLILFVSNDEGKTWNQQSVVGPDQEEPKPESVRLPLPILSRPPVPEIKPE